VERDAFEAFVLDTSGEVTRFVHRRVTPQDVADVVADTYAIAWMKCDAIPAEADRAWVYAVALNVVRNHHRTNRRLTRLQERLARGDRSEGIPEDRPSSEEIAKVRAALRRLRESDQEVLRLIEWDELDASTAASVLGCTQQAFRVRLHRARRRFAEQLSRVDQDASRAYTASTKASTHHAG
jgi:RNA polymerase sigma-70 factor (ECF subfamily)